MMTELIMLIICAGGIADILARHYIFSWWREWVAKTFPYNDTLNTFVNCPVCLSFWAAFVLSFFFPPIFATIDIMNAFLAGVATAFVVDIIMSHISY